MRKIILTLFSLAMLFGLSLTAFAVSEPEILREPQNLTWPENSVAGYSVANKKYLSHPFVFLHKCSNPLISRGFLHIGFSKRFISVYKSTPFDTNLVSKMVSKIQCR